MIVPIGGTVVAGRFRPAQGSPSRDAAPLKLYVPRSRADVVTAVKEVRVLGQRLTVRGPGDRFEEAAQIPGVVLSIERLDRILALHTGAGTVTVEPGVLVHKLDEYLAGHGLGLAVSASERTRCVGSFATLAGSSASSHREGLFLDHVLAIEQVGLDARARTHRRNQGPTPIGQLLERGQAITTKLTLAVAPIDKQRLIVARRARYFRNLSDFLAGSGAQLRHLDDARLQSARFVDLPLGRETVTLGVVRSWREVERQGARRMLTTLERGRTALLGEALPHLSGRLSDLATAASLLGPRETSLAQAERDGSHLLGNSWRTRVYRMLVPVDRYETALWAIYNRATAERRESGTIRSIALDVAAVRSPYLRQEEGTDCCELRLTLGLARNEPEERSLAAFAAQIDKLCATQGGRRLLLPTLSFGH